MSRVQLCGHYFNKGIEGRIKYVCDDWRHCKFCRQSRTKKEQEALRSFFALEENVGQPIFVKEFEGGDFDHRAELYTLKLRRAGKVYRRYPLIDRTVVLFSGQFDKTAQDILLVEVLAKVESWTEQPLGKNISGKLGASDKPESKEGEEIREWLWKTDAPFEVEEKIRQQAKVQAEAVIKEVYSAAAYIAKLAIFEQIVTALLAQQGFCLLFSYHVKQLRVFTKKTDISIPDGYRKSPDSRETYVVVVQ